MLDYEQHSPNDNDCWLVKDCGFLLPSYNLLKLRATQYDASEHAY
jgi:hypothetical protein